MNWFNRTQQSRQARVEPFMPGKTRGDLKISAFALDGWQVAQETPWRVAKPLPGVLPTKTTSMAMDDANALYSYEALQSQGANIAFPGFPLLAELAQRPEYRHISETIAREMTRKWGELTSADDEDKSEKIEALTAAIERHNLRERFRMASVYDGLFGRGHIYIDVGNRSNVSAILPRDSKSIPKGANLRFSNVEPVWTYPNGYNANNPLDEDFYRPRSWFVMGQAVDRSRLLTFISRPLPDILKPAYGFAGLSLSQMAIPYVQNWLRTRQSVSDLLHSFSVMVLATNMASVLSGGGNQSLIARLQLFNQTRDNRSVMAVDKEQEQLSNVAAPIAGLDKLQAQAQEQMASVSGIPLVKLLGITPSGLNASADGEIRVFYDTIAAAQEALFSDHMRTCLEFIQLAEFGEIDPAIKWRWKPLWQLDEAGQAAVRKTEADTDAVYIETGVLSQLDVRQRIARDPESVYVGIEADDVPDPPQVGMSDPSDTDTDKVDRDAESGSNSGANSGV